jgi:hypothetical protein
MNIVQTSRALGLSIGLIAASAVLMPTSASAATLYVSDYSGVTNVIYKFAEDGSKTTFATGISAYALAVDSSGNLFSAGSGTINKFTPSGVKTTFATGDSSYALAFDASGNLFSSVYSEGIYKYTPSGVRTTFATANYVGNYYGLAFDSSNASNPTTAVPEPFTIFGTLIGGTAALRMRKKLKSSGKV